MTGFETRKPDWLSFDEASRRVQALTGTTASARIPLDSALGHAVSQEITARLTLPPGPTSHMDGYAVRLADVDRAEDGAEKSRPIPVVGSSRPGAPWLEPLPLGAAVRIMTGALVPEGADTVIPVERTDREAEAESSVRFSFEGEAERRQPGRHVRPAGEEVTRGDRLAVPGEAVTPGLIALLAATGDPDVPVYREPRVALVITGDELVPAGDPEALKGGILKADVLSPSLPPLIRHAGGSPIQPLRIGDDELALMRGLKEVAARADVIITTGGASMGEGDLVKRVLEKLGFELDFWRVKMRPGSPVSLGRLPVDGRNGSVPVLGLPGNPVSALVTFLTLGVPALRTLGGHTRRRLPSLRAVALEPMGGPADLTRFFRVRLERDSKGKLGTRLAGGQGSGVIRSMALAQGLAMVPEGVEAIDTGQSVEVLAIPLAGWT